MSKNSVGELGYVLIGTITSAGIGTLLLQGIGALILGILGAFGGYFFSKVLKPKLDKLFNKKNEDKAQ